MISLEIIARVELAAGPVKLSAIISEARRQVLRECTSADEDGNLDTNLFWPAIRALRAVGARPIMPADKASLADLSPESMARWRSGEGSARRDWLAVRWELPAQKGGGL